VSEQTRRLGERYELGGTLGRGGMAEVHEGTDLRLGRRVAIKILRPDLAKDPSFQKRFRREAQSAAALNHPNIVAVYDTGEDTLGDGPEAARVPYIVMELVDGMTLRQLLASGRRLLPERALEITSGVLAALDYSHRHGIVHRDIKPANVMLTQQGDVKVMDFGIARALADSARTMTQGSAVLGTAQYLSPEQARGEVVDARSDLYSTGCLLYELLTSRPPFIGDSPVSVAYQHVSEPPTAPSTIDPGVPRDIDPLVLTALAKSPDDRYQTAAAMRADVDRAIAGLPVAAPMPASVLPSSALDQTARLAPVSAAGAASVTRPANKTGRWVALTLGVIAVIVAMLFVGRAVFGSSESQKVAVPNLTGLTVAQAQISLSNVGLTLGQQTPAQSDKPKDTIIAQQPSVGEQLEKGQAVNVTVSLGQAAVPVPNLIDLTDQDAARTALTAVNLTLGKVTMKDSDKPEGFVIGQDPVAGVQVAAGSPVNIVVSSGNAKVPNVVNESEAQAKSDIVNAGFQPNVITQEDGTVAAGTVLAQTPKGGTSAKKGTSVTITVATAPPTPTPTPTPTATTPTPTASPT